MSEKIPKSISFRVCVYRSEEDEGYIAHCLELDVIGAANNVEGALDELLEVIETQLESCELYNAQVLFPAPEEIWEKYNQAKKARRKISPELLDRVIRNANRRLGHTVEDIFDYIVGTQEVPPECLAQA